MLYPEQPFKQRLHTGDIVSLLALAFLFTGSVFASWQRWTQPLLDHGREMNLPARILAGERLYADVQFLYGPFAPHFNALLYGMFGVQLSVLKASGAVSGVLILLLVYWLSRRLMGVWESAATTGLVLAICAMKSTATYIQPYAYAALYGLVFALCSLANIVRFIERRSESLRLVEETANRAQPLEGGTLNLVLAGSFAGLAAISKPEIAMAAFGAAAAAWIIERVSTRRWLWRDAVWFTLPAIVVVIVAYGYILGRVPLRVLLNDNHILFTNMPPQLVYFNRHISGLAAWPRSAWFTLSGVGVFVMWAGICTTIGALASMRKRTGGIEALKTGAILLIIGAVWRETAIEFLGVPSDVTPFASAILILPATIAVIGYRIWKSKARVSFSDRTLLIISVFGLLSILRAFLNVTTTGPYTPFFIPVVIIVYLDLLFHRAPIFQDDSIRSAVRRVAICLVGALVIGMTIHSTQRFRRLNRFPVTTSRGSFLTSREIGEPLAAAIRYVEQHTGPEDSVLALPVATTINFLTARRYPFREEIVHPGFLNGEKEDEAIERLHSLRVPLILIANLDTSEFRDRTFGVDYNLKLMEWIRRNYHTTARFDSPVRGEANFGKEPFFITVYERNQ